VGFVAHQLRLLKINLTHDCADQFEDCEGRGSARAPSTCIGGDCVSVDVDVRDLRRIEPGDELAGAELLPWYCSMHDCEDDAGGGAGGPGQDDGVQDNDTATSSGGSGSGDDGSGGMDAAMDSGEVADAMPDATIDACVEEHDGGHCPPPVANCIPARGYFADVDRRLAATADCTLCPVIAQNRLSNDFLNMSPEAAKTQLLLLIKSALDFQLDIVELWVAQDGPTLYAAGESEMTTHAPLLEDMLADTRLMDADQPLKLFLSAGVSTDPAELANTLLPFLLAKQAEEEGGYGSEGRPLYLEAEKPYAVNGLAEIQTQLASDSTYAPLRGHIHFGGYLGTDVTAGDARSSIDMFVDTGFDFVEIDSKNMSFLPLVRYAQSKGLHVFGRDLLDVQDTALCGIVDALASPVQEYGNLGQFHRAVTTTTTLVDFDVADSASAATQLTYTGLRGQQQLTLGAETPALVSEDETGALPGTSLSFDAASSQSLTLNDPELPAGFRRMSVLALLQFDPTTITLPANGRAVIASKRQGSTGWALELVDDGGKQVRFQVFFRNVDNSVQERHASIAASAFSAGVSYLLVGGLDRGAYLWQAPANPVNAATDVDYYYTVPENDAPITLGRDPGASDGYFTGKLQLLKVTSYLY
jgi:hypothetical protein